MTTIREVLSKIGGAVLPPTEKESGDREAKKAALEAQLGDKSVAKASRRQAVEIEKLNQELQVMREDSDMARRVREAADFGGDLAGQLADLQRDIWVRNIIREEFEKDLPDDGEEGGEK